MQYERVSSPGTPVRYGRYEVLFRVAAGGMAEVYAARIVGEGGFEKMVALKRMLPTLAEDEKFVAMFLDEGRVAANISSPHVVQTLDLGRAEDESLYLVMELVVGVSLSALMRKLSQDRAVLPVPVAAELIAQAAQGLHDAHEARTVYGEPLGIVHRDVSPQNVLVDVSGRVRITDFGVARALQRITQTQSGEVKGKLAYFAPEQARAKELDRRADVFALGIVAWETFTGERLFAGDSPAETLMKLVEMTVPRLDQVRAEVPRALADAVAHALERDLAKRTPDAATFAQELRRGCVTASPSEIATFVRAHGGESLMRLEEGLRTQSPSSSTRSMTGARVRAQEATGALAPRDDSATLVTPSTPMHLPDDARSGVRGAASAGVSASVEAPSLVAAPAPPSRGVPVPVMIGVVAVVAALAAVAALAFGGGPDAEARDAPMNAAPTLAPAAQEREATVTAEPEQAPAPGVPTEGASMEAAAERRAGSGRRTSRAPTPPAPTPPVERVAVAAPPIVVAPPVAAVPAPVEPPAPEVRREPAPVDPPAPEVRREPEPAPEPRPVLRQDPPEPPPPEPVRRPGAMRGLDDFERELGR